MGVLTDIAGMGTAGELGKGVQRALGGGKKRNSGSADADDSSSKDGGGAGGVLGDVMTGIGKLRNKKRSNGKSRGGDS